METQKIKLTKIEQNKGQIPGVPTNPRQWKKQEIERLKASVMQDPGMMEARPLLVYPQDEKYVIIGGNMRFAAVKALGWKEVPCFVIGADTDVQTLKRWAIKDNGSFGEWDMDMLANEWDDLPLNEWGVPVWDTDAADISPEGDGTAEDDAKEQKVFDSRILVCSVSLNGESEDIVLCSTIPGDKTEDVLRAINARGKEAVVDAILKSIGV